PRVLGSEWLGALMPLYPATAGLSSPVISRDIARARGALAEPISDPLPEALCRTLGLMALPRALETLHRPASHADALAARRRVAFDELFVLSLAMRLLGATRHRPASALGNASMQPFWSVLPFGPTDAQRAAVCDIVRDLTSGRTMNRMIQGDVGSGKTLVAAAAAYFVAQSGLQTALMAPTELLAEQHARTLETLLSPLGLSVCLITGSMDVKSRRTAAARLAAGEAFLAVGTHALLSGDTQFAHLGLVITDEQHRFGVAQRAALSAKGNAPHTLVMSATPIPRTLSLILYGDLDVSVIGELPPGRSPIATYRIGSDKRMRALGFVRDRLDEGQQAYVICPLVENDEQSPPGLLSAAEEWERLRREGFSSYHLGLLHGRMKPHEKEATMRAFVQGEVQLLVATTVVEVGVDVPNATVILIENAERFGLSQLHQLRGRVGRGTRPSTCILVSDATGSGTQQRLRALCRTSDGFRIAEEDLHLRGPGDFLGVRQHGLPGLLNADLAADAPLLEMAQREAQVLLESDPTLAAPRHAALSTAARTLIAQVGESPN
ncbi:MAG: ATP-dependent DNA helicase RecG, partial [Oscillospiraceae bacterium]